MGRFDVDVIAAGIEAQKRGLLARGITLVESEQPRHAPLAEKLLGRLWDRTGGALRIGISGVPGVGKSTFIDAFGMLLIEAGLKVAVLAIDPSSRVSGGSVLGDKTRMSRLSRAEGAFIRPSPTSGTLGGVARKTRESMLLCEAAGFDVILVETVGVGQSETMVADLVDIYLVLMLAGAGDELQGIKRGILEVADVLAINKADGDNARPAERAQGRYRAALHLMRGADAPPVLTCSALEGHGLGELWQTLEERWNTAKADGSLEARRRKQDVHWMWRLIEDPVLDALHRSAGVVGLEDGVRTGRRSARDAARVALEQFRWPPKT